MEHSATAQASVAVEVPYFVASVIMPVLPDFFEAVELGPFGIKRMSFSPDARRESQYPDMECGWVAFEPAYRNAHMVTFNVEYLPGEEGTRGSLGRINGIDYKIGGTQYFFRYLEHVCGCPNCCGMKYPFLPHGISAVSFRHMKEMERLLAIRAYLNTR